MDTISWWGMLGLGAYHGINPGMGWLFAVALGMQEKRRSAVIGALFPMALGTRDFYWNRGSGNRFSTTATPEGCASHRLCGCLVWVWRVQIFQRTTSEMGRHAR